MKYLKKMSIATLVALGLIFAGNTVAFAAETQPAYENEVSWGKKKEKEVKEEEAPKEAPKQEQTEPEKSSKKEDDAPKQEQKDEETSTINSSFIIDAKDSDALEVFMDLARGGGYLPYRGGGTSNTGGANTSTTNQNFDSQTAPNGMQIHPNGHQNNQYKTGISEELHRLTQSQNKVQLHPDAYIVQQDDGLWLIVGNIRAKLDMLIYVDHKNMEHQQQQTKTEGDFSIPMYK